MNSRTPCFTLPTATQPVAVLFAAVLLAALLATAGCQPKPSHYVQVQVQLVTAGVDPAAWPALRAQTIQVLEKRFHSAGVEGVLILEDPAAADRLRVCFPGKTLPDGMPGSLLNQTKLELRFEHPSNASAPEPEGLAARFQGTLPEGYVPVLLLEKTSGSASESYILVAAAPIITDADIEDAKPDNSQGRPSVSFTLRQEGAERFGRATGANIGRRIAIVLDGDALSAPTIQSKITDSGIITGLDTPQEAEDLALCLRSHSLPCKVSVLGQKVVRREDLP
jgi:protein-export membrane protein SecD